MRVFHVWASGMWVLSRRDLLRQFDGAESGWRRAGSSHTQTGKHNRDGALRQRAGAAALVRSCHIAAPVDTRLGCYDVLDVASVLAATKRHRRGT